MGVRQPPSDSDDGPEVIEFGIAALDGIIEDAGVDFPITTRALAAELGEESVPYDVYGNTIRLDEVLEYVEDEEFDSKPQLLNELHPIFEHYRERSSRSVLQQVRALLPF